MKFSEMSDDDVFSLFSDFYKDVNGFRPRGFSREYAVSWMEFEMQPERQEARRKEWEAEAAWIEEMARREEEDQEEIYREAQERMFYEMERNLV